MKRSELKYIMPLLMMVFFITKSLAIVKPNSLFSNNMVLQQGVIVPIWGTANEGEKVTVEFNGQKVSTVAKDGKWLLKLKPLKASNKPSVMTISGENTIKIENILIGEVWVCSGQSNMERQLGPRPPQKPIYNWEIEKAAANYPEIRQFFVAHKASDTMLSDVNSQWVICDTTSVINFSAVGYFFVRELYKKYHVPIGLLFSSVGGTPAENWTTRATLEANTELKSLAENYDKAVKNYALALDSFNKSKATIYSKWVADTMAASIAHKKIPQKPTPPRNPAGGAGGLYNAMINPLIPFAIKGVIWYQGESNGGRGKQYRTLFPTMITDWRKHWNQGEFPFLFVQLAPYKGTDMMIREAQLMTLDKVPNSAMAVTTDCGDSIDIHPTHKQPVGERLALAARALAYNEKIEYSGPLYKGYEVKGNSIEISFTHVGKGLLAKDGDLKGFTISADGKNFMPAKAEIKGNKVVVSSPDVTSPTAARFAWIQSPTVNFYNEDGLPASPFRTDVD